ncbi:hypothetical protein L228DRAFT_243164 [Xylona heveae TC161]|uniref:Uncharacterized protein n=1 Tax=Xylona heveae (strain CBS 132557 / TC161) TaxID=1328760 RepID=A0A165JV11_XYLHT|nr:hypothetical protein L228DRAFT_243164 [Xylona heveae TC161]KZF26666.1 hypothetical protein L228DRAFT_243164 [Xylona heveae TC161]
MSVDSLEINAKAGSSTKHQLPRLGSADEERSADIKGASSKRARPVVEANSDLTAGPNKRRLLHSCQVTSRQTRPFAAPAPHGVNQNSLRAAIRSRQRALGSDGMRRQAWLNSLRIRGSELKELDREAFELVERHHREQSRSIEPAPPAHPVPRLLSSSLGLSNYDAFDAEDIMLQETEDSGPPLIYSDFNFTDSNTPIAPSGIWDSAMHILDEPNEDHESSSEELKEAEQQSRLSFTQFI